MRIESKRFKKIIGPLVSGFSMNPFHFFTRAAVEQFERNFTQFLIHNPVFQAFAHHSSKKAKDLANKVNDEILRKSGNGATPDVKQTMRRLVDNMRK